MRGLRRSHLLLPVVLMSVALSMLGAMSWATAGAQERVPDKFIPTALVKYGNSAGSDSAKATARFDMLLAAEAFHSNRYWMEGYKNAWQSLKQYNPDMIILPYQMGPGTYNTAKWGRIGDGWEWLVANHGPDKPLAERWVSRGLISGKPLSNTVYRNERCMYMGNPDWINYYLDHLYRDMWGSGKHKGAGGVFADLMGYEISNYNNLVVENTDTRDFYSEYYVDGAYDFARYKADVNRAFETIITGLATTPEKLIYVPNFGRMAEHPEYWRELDQLPHPPFAAMEETGIVQKYGGGYRVYAWDTKINTMRDMKNTAVIFVNQGSLTTNAQGLARMDVPDNKGNMGAGTTGWDALWFAMTSFLMALNENKTNGFFAFTIWGYANDYYWFDEFDPAYIHLGKPVADYFVKDGIAYREYEDGWVVANKTPGNNRTGLPIPNGGEARVINHGNFRDPDSVPLVSTFELNAYRGVILLKPGKQLGNADN